MLQVLELKNFRGFEEVQLSGLRRLNVVTGLNGSGKTSILEAAFLVSGAANAALIASLYAFRGEFDFSPDVDRPFRSIFRYLDTNRVPQITATSSAPTADGKGSQRELHIRPKYSVAKGQASTTQSTVLMGVAFEFSGPSGKAESTWGWADNLGLQQAPGPKWVLGGEPNDNPDLISGHYVSPYVRDLMHEDHKLLTRLVTERRMQELVSALALIAPTLKMLHPLMEGNRPVIYADIGGPALLPISLLGAGLINCLHIVLPSIMYRNAIILIDEFEDGIHHTLLTPLLDAVIKLANHNQNQLFISTHSNELLRHLIDLETARQADDVVFFRLGKKGMQGAIPSYSLEEASGLLESNMDIR